LRGEQLALGPVWGLELNLGLGLGLALIRCMGLELIRGAWMALNGARFGLVRRWLVHSHGGRVVEPVRSICARRDCLARLSVLPSQDYIRGGGDSSRGGVRLENRMRVRLSHLNAVAVDFLASGQSAASPQP
jgi:hypothetical protein